MDAKTLHDLKNPLTVITCQTQMVQRRIRKGAVPDKGQLLASLDTIEQMAAKINADIESLASDKQENALPPA